ncbi:glycine zipper 2TM domain-containing protein [Pedobacter sp. ISL-68]|uniref:YMGG-like glycine zipper-containing protein n=1 Tax=unclassified Pedobacter TaxID=2628915 RepID=UPI001BE8DF82|nr:MULTISPECIES: YMGG-like glycine zipper-containing protein [unclassified Pedobacter]MBT2561925.1 glycine zipper 2TM domain-containing protein [Pedobacter sp. ISL-64]MBT2591512.1 glycine zipper 2TM domain-containing protein [Pedobacter sp. ISL-68]
MKKILIVIALSTSVLFACNNKAKEEAALKQQEAEKQLAIKAVKDSLRLDSFKKAEVAKVEQEKEAKHQAELVAARRAGANSSRSYASSGGGSSSAYGGTTQPTAKKKGWSDAAKGTVIGGVGGAVAGALIDKKKGRGAVIGGLVGAGGGYLIGRGEDRKSGRVQPKN